MKGSTVLELAQDNSKMFVADFSDPSGAAFLGDLPQQMQNEMVTGLAQSIGGTMVQSFPVNILKSKDAKNVRVTQTVYIFSPDELINFAQRLFIAAVEEQGLAEIPAGGTA